MTEMVSRYAPREFGGETYDEDRDGHRLRTLLARVKWLNGHWRTLDEIAAQCGGSEASVSARLRDLRKSGWTVERKYRSAGVWIYRLAPHRSEIIREEVVPTNGD